jgi:hypothetical protein
MTVMVKDDPDTGSVSDDDALFLIKRSSAFIQSTPDQSLQLSPSLTESLPQDESFLLLVPSHKQYIRSMIMSS